MIEWRIKGREFANCNCSYVCPCQFNAPPTHGNCVGAGAYFFDEGYFGEVRLDGLHAAAVYRWPGAVHEGNGEVQAVVDERADAAQREALFTIMAGEETEPMATVWAVFATVVTKVHPPLVKPFDFEVDVEARTARLVIPGVLEASGRPIRNPVTGADTRVRIDLPDGFEFTLAEIGSGASTATGPIAFTHTDSYGQFAEIHLSNTGVVR